MVVTYKLQRVSIFQKIFKSWQKNVVGLLETSPEHSHTLILKGQLWEYKNLSVGFFTCEVKILKIWCSLLLWRQQGVNEKVCQINLKIKR